MYVHSSWPSTKVSAIFAFRSFNKILAYTYCSLKRQTDWVLLGKIGAEN
jgi:hypothetical protein